MRLCLSVLFALLVVRTTLGQESHGAEGGSEGSTTFCAGSLQMLREEIMQLLNSEEYTVYINCLAFGEERELDTAIASRFPRNNQNKTATRFVLECRNNGLLALPSAQPAIRFNLTAQTYSACVDCVDAENMTDVCPTECPDECDRCYGLSSDVICTECVYYRLLNNYPPAQQPTAEEIEEDREGEEHEECEEISPDPELGTSFSCVVRCPDMGGNYSAPSEGGDRTCYACGLEYCVTCEPAEGPGGHAECRECLEGTVRFEGECFACPEALIARTAIVQEEEEREEERANLINRIELGVALPIVSLLVIAFFLLMSVYAHYRYPHISHKGHKRHRRKPEALAESPGPVENEGPGSGEDDTDPLSQSSVWHSRPTIRIR